MKELSLILPVHNEADIITPVYKDIRRVLDRLKVGYECILVENGSTDNTLGVATTLAKRFANTRVITAPKGYGSAVLTGVRAAQGRYICYMPSDGQIELAVIPRLWRLIKTGNWNVVKVRRTTRESLDRKLVSSFFSWILSRAFDIPGLDVNGSPRILTFRDMKALHLVYTDSFIDAEFAVKAHALGWKIKEIPMRTLSRRGGVSTRSLATYWEFVRNLYEFRRHTI